MKENGETKSDFIVTRDELAQICWETMDMINGLRIAINTHAEVMGLHRYLLERFIPAPTLTAAVNEYAELRAKAIAEQTAKEANGASIN